MFRNRKYTVINNSVDRFRLLTIPVGIYTLIYIIVYSAIHWQFYIEQTSPVDDWVHIVITLASFAPLTALYLRPLTRTRNYIQREGIITFGILLSFGITLLNVLLQKQLFEKGNPVVEINQITEMVTTRPSNLYRVNNFFVSKSDTVINVYTYSQSSKYSPRYKVIVVEIAAPLNFDVHQAIWMVEVYQKSVREKSQVSYEESEKREFIRECMQEFASTDFMPSTDHFEKQYDPGIASLIHSKHRFIDNLIIFKPMKQPVNQARQNFLLMITLFSIPTLILLVTQFYGFRDT